jgi:L-ascorbate metabolism protein UlaG (beta-lactamase superfamily)
MLPQARSTFAQVLIPTFSEAFMRMHFLRNATFLLQTDRHQILVDPMLGPPGSLMSLTFVRGM